MAKASQDTEERSYMKVGGERSSFSAPISLHLPHEWWMEGPLVALPLPG